MIDKWYKKLEKLHSRDIKIIKDDQGGTRNPYKCMNIMKQYVMDDKIIEGCKTWEKQIFQQEKCYAHKSQNTHTHTHTQQV